MFLLVSGQHGISIQISINLGKTFVCISSIRKISVTWILARVFAYLRSSFFLRFWTLSVERFLFLFWSILNGVTLKTSNSLCNFNLESLWYIAYVISEILVRLIEYILLIARQRAEQLYAHNWSFFEILIWEKSFSFPLWSFIAIRSSAFRIC